MKNTTIAIVLAFILSFLFSCRTNQQNKIIGTWKYVHHTKPDTTNIRLFNYFSSGDLEVQDIEGTDTTFRKYSYTIDGSELNIFGNDADLGPYWSNPNEYRGKYWVHVLDKTHCKIEKTEHGDGSDGNAYLRVELVK